MRACFCPACGASLNFEGFDRDFAFCQYCGTKIMLDDHRETHRVIDEARIIEAQSEHEIRLKELEFEEREMEKGRKGRRIAYIIALAFILGSILFSLLFGSEWIAGGILIGAYIAMFTFISGDDQKKKAKEAREDARMAHTGKIKLPSEAAYFEDENCYNIQAIYQSLGFKNVKLVNLRDLQLGLKKKVGTVEDVTINGKDVRSGHWYDPNDVVIITYHGFVNDRKN
ncbi:MAG: zinc ribbon domain-containing protein [Oscillospiraceae bacterium]|nr:zinc ribbon domain-containing protein [Oscillospiraceae bacterium]